MPFSDVASLYRPIQGVPPPRGNIRISMEKLKAHLLPMPLKTRYSYFTWLIFVTFF